MNRADFDKLVADTVKATADLLVAKGAEYAGDADRLANFKRNAVKNGQTVLEVWQTYWGKHIDGINTYMARVKDQALRIALEEVIAKVQQGYKPEADSPNPTEYWAAISDPEKFRRRVDKLVPAAMAEIDRQLSEPIEGRFHDNINYSFLVLALLKELRETTA